MVISKRNWLKIIGKKNPLTPFEKGGIFVPPFSKGVRGFFLNLWRILDKKNSLKSKFLIPLTIFFMLALNCLYAQKTPLATYKLEGKWHFIASDGSTLFAPQLLDEVTSFKEGYFRVMKKINNKEKWYFLDSLGETAVTPDCDYVFDYSEGLALTVNNLDEQKLQNKFGFIDQNGKQVIPMIYNDAESFSEGLAYAAGNETRGWLDKKGNFVITLKTKVNGYTFHDGLAMISNSEYKIGFVDKHGNEVIPLIFDEAGSFSEGLAFANTGYKLGYIDGKGKLVIPAQFDYCDDFHNGVAFVGFLDKRNAITYGAIDKTGKFTIPFKFEKARSYSEGLAAVKLDGKWGYVDVMGSFTLMHQFSAANSFINGLAFAENKEENKIGFINKKGEFIVILPKCEHVVDLRLNKLVY
ncbi:MAG: hypothetical protein HW421_2666 [Ignavibacteria bacterium]|nr:hypothetical protein [Ignavibacteria bacterium]